MDIAILILGCAGLRPNQRLQLPARTFKRKG
jgi:hypothetical protein